MKNLTLLYNRKKDLRKNYVKHIALSTETLGVTYISTDHELLSFDWNKLETNEIGPINNVIGIEYLSLNNELCVATNDGDVIVHNLSTGAEESVTFCDGGIESMSWSYDQEVVAFITKTNLLVVMNSAYDPMNEDRLDDDEFGEEQFINVGWGKKETQFHGTEGKAAAKSTVNDVIVDDFNQIDKKMSIVWRGDDEYFAVSFVGNWGRMFKVYDKEGKLKYTSEKCAGLEAPIAWRPSGSWIAIPQVLPNKYTIALFEKNGLRHREIVLPFKVDEERVYNLLWSSDSDILAIHTKRAETSNVYLYTICNYHWYLKQTLNFNGKCQALQWDLNYSEGKTLHILQENGTYLLYRWEHVVNHSRGLTSADQSLVGVLDGANVLLTNFRGAIIPPPMCGSSLSHTTSINHIGFLCHSDEPQNTNRFFIVDTTNTFSVYKYEFICDAQQATSLLNSVKLIKKHASPFAPSETPLCYYHWLWLNEQQVIFCENDNLSTILYLSELNTTENLLKILDKCIVNGIIGNVTSDRTKRDTITYHLTTGEFYSLSIAEQKWQQKPQNLFNLNYFCERIEMAATGKQTKVISLKYQQNLYIDDRKIATDVTSLTCANDFILFTTLDQLKFIRLDNEQIINERRIERGGKLILTVSRDSRTILQLPRGNLEAIQPRILSLCIIGEFLDAGFYRKAFDLLRKQRINLNLLVDHNPGKFIENISNFVDDINNAQWLNLFLSDLQSDDVTVTMYSSNYRHLKNNNHNDNFCFGDNKINTVCEKFCYVFGNTISTKYLLPLLTTHVKRKNLETALEIIWSVRQTELNSPNTILTVSSHEALKYLLYLVNVNELYDVALGMYDFDLVLFVAQKSQKDPKEYIPFLNELKNFEEHYRKYRIDNHLKRYERALGHIVKCGVEKLEECLDLIEKQNLYTNALRLFKKSDECYNEIVLQYADYLRSNGIFYDACLMYERGGDLKQAILTAKHTLDWHKCLLLAQNSSYSKEEIQQLCLSLIPALQENGKYKEAADLVKHTQNDMPVCIKLLCEGKHYQDAIFESKTLAEPLDEFVRLHLSDYANQLITKFSTDINQYTAYVQRLQKIRKDKTEKLLNGIEDDVDNCDMFSDTSSMNSSRFTGTSKGSGKSHRSSKNRRKHERKLLSLKVGNPFEDIALVDVIYNLVQKSFNQQQMIRGILLSLIDLELDETGVQLQRIYGKLLSVVKDSLDEVWIPEMMVSGEVKVEEIMDYVKVQNDQHYAMIKQHQRVKPFLNIVDWQFEILK